MLSFKHGQSVIHDWYTHNGSRVYTFVRANDDTNSIVRTEDGRELALMTSYLQPFTKSPPPDSFRGRFLVWSPNAPKNPSCVHPTATDAGLEARRLANKTGQDFYVVEIKGGYRQPVAVRPPLQEI